ncbi:MAG: DHH family phosphoesterase [Candidatus Thermoplasmatota archaeon]|nr:DHH family phosphoesterase [Candidatus Thermoplasmatota archaeon]
MEIDKGKTSLFLIHQHADPDAIGSSYYFSKNYGGDVASPTSPSKSGQKLLSFLDFTLNHEVDFEIYDQVIILDTPHPDQLKPLDTPLEKTSIIDHHPSNSWDRDVHFEDRTSCSEIVYDLIEPEDLTRKEGVALASGILSDSSSLQRGDFKTFLTLGKILKKADIDLQDVKNILFEPRSHSEKIARLKGTERSSFEETEGFIIAHTEIGAFEGSVASYLLEGGADIALAVNRSGNNDDLRISGRAVDEVTERGVDIGKIFKDISKDKKDMHGGGHPGAAVLNVSSISKEERSYLDLCMNEIVSSIKEKGLDRPKD